MVIGICDDHKLEIEEIKKICNLCKDKLDIELQIVEFSNGEDVIYYCEQSDSELIHLLFLDVEMPGISGIELKDLLISNNTIFRIVFITSHQESIYSSFSVKTIGFINKPASEKDIMTKIDLVLEDIRKNIKIEYRGYNGEAIYVQLENILYYEGAKNYTKVYMRKSDGGDVESLMIATGLAQIEDEMRGMGLIRIHKSYIANMTNIEDVKNTVRIKGAERQLPLGRVYKEQVRLAYKLFGKEQIRKRLCYKKY